MEYFRTYILEKRHTCVLLLKYILEISCTVALILEISCTVLLAVEGRYGNQAMLAIYSKGTVK